MRTRDYEVILDSMQMTGVYVIREDNHKILYFNRRVKEVAPNIETGMVCHEIWAGSCSNCPLLYIGDKKESRSVNYDDPFGKIVDIAATRMLWEDEIPAFMIAVTPHAEAASYTYHKILRANLNTGSYEILKMDQSEEQDFPYLSASLAEYFNEFLKSGYVYPDDEKRFKTFSGIEYLKRELRSGKSMLSCTYRRKSADAYRWYIMEVVPDFDYADYNQAVRIYVKDVHDIYREGLEHEEVNIQNQQIIKSLGEMNFGIYVIDLRTGRLNPVRASEDVRHMVSSGKEKWDEVFEKILVPATHADYREEFVKKYSLASLRNFWETGQKKIEMLCQQMLDGAYHFASVTAHFYENKSGSGYVVLALQDVDERTRKDIERTQSDKEIAAIIRSRYNIMNTVHLDTGKCERIFLDLADESVRTLEGDYERYITKALEEAVYEEDREVFRENFLIENLRRKAAEVEDSAEMVCQYRIKGNPVTWIEAHVFYVKRDSGRVVNILDRDITREKLREEANTRADRAKANIINCLSSMFFAAYYLDLDKDTFRVVTQYDEVGGILANERKCSEALCTYAQNFVHPEDREEYLERMGFQNLLNSLSKERPLIAFEYRRVRTENGIVVKQNGWIRANVVLAETADGKPKTALYVAQDITEIKEKEEREHSALKEACDAANHANASKSEFLSRMSHDIRTPMNAIIGMTAIAGTHLDDRERVSDCLNKITVASKHLLSLINEVLDMSKIESGKIDLAEEDFNLADMVQNLLTMIRPAVQEKHHELELYLGRIEHEDVIGDVRRLQRVFMNLLGNAVKYTPPGGKLELEITEKASKTYGYGCYEFVFRDNGIGMDGGFLERIFEPFSRTEDSRVSKIEGTGLGMTIAQNIVHMMNGDISVESEVGKGSQFTVTVFLKLSNTSAVDVEQLADLPVLVVDDDECACETACEVLADIGMKGQWVLCGREAVECVAKAHEEDRDFFAVIVDWKMPGMDGIETARAIRSEVGSEVPIIILSAYDWTEIEEEARMAGVDGFISKPLFKSRLIYLFRELKGMDNRKEAVKSEKEAVCSFEGKRILLAEDNDLNREIAEEIIGAMGVKVESVVNGKEAVEQFEKMGEGYYDLILMDIQMPVMNGHEASRTIRSMERSDAASIPIIAMTANAFSEDVAASKKAGMNEHISKPLDVEQLMMCMRHWLGGAV